MSTNFTGDPLSDDEIARHALDLRRAQGLGDWPAAGFVDTEKRCFMKPEVRYVDSDLSGHAFRYEDPMGRG
ncbi:MAG: hypothetical protein ACYC5H_16520 [Methylovirgula sp.]